VLLLNCMSVNFQYSSSDGAFMPRHAALRAGIPIERPAVAVNRLCGSGFQALVSGAQVSKQRQKNYKDPKKS
jgi:acetyl-CoA acetyltransferase